MQAEPWYLWTSLAAIGLGPLIAVIITRAIDHWRDKKMRRYNVFRNLMQTRGIRLDPLHVSALNLIEVEFYDDKKVRSAYRVYIEHLSAPMPAVNEQNRFFEQRHDLFLSLVAEVGRKIGYKFDKHDLGRLAYAPEGWNSDQTLQRQNALMLSEILSGRRAIPISPFVPANNPFPAPPEIEQKPD